MHTPSSFLVFGQNRVAGTSLLENHVLDFQTAATDNIFRCSVLHSMPQVTRCTLGFPAYARHTQWLAYAFLVYSITYSCGRMCSTF